jgi:hypothetical protein
MAEWEKSAIAASAFSACAGKKRQPRRLGQAAQLQADRRLAQMQALRCARYVSLTCNGYKSAQGLKFHDFYICHTYKEVWFKLLAQRGSLGQTPQR